MAQSWTLGLKLLPGIDASKSITIQCDRLAGARISMPLPFGTATPPPQNADTFLASKRIRIAHTAFDRDWARVRNESLSRATYTRLLGAAPGDKEATLLSVNRWVNRSIAYTEDRDLYGTADFWAGARRTLKQRKGDCEDIALLKMQMLAAAGIKREDMFLTIAKDLVRHADHAVLIVRTAGTYRMLDNASDEVIDAAPQSDYRAILSFSAGGTWLHGATVPVT